jgi:hypothetical protein
MTDDRRVREIAQIVRAHLKGRTLTLSRILTEIRRYDAASSIEVWNELKSHKHHVQCVDSARLIYEIH